MSRIGRPSWKPQSQQLDAPQRFAPAARLVLLKARGFSEDRLGPGPVEVARQTGVVIGDSVEGSAGFGGLFARAVRLAAPGDVAGDAVEEGPEAVASREVKVFEGAAAAQALHEDVLHDVFEILQQRRAAPTGGKIVAKDRGVAPGELLALALGPEGAAWMSVQQVDCGFGMIAPIIAQVALILKGQVGECHRPARDCFGRTNGSEIWG